MNVVFHIYMRPHAPSSTVEVPQDSCLQLSYFANSPFSSFPSPPLCLSSPLFPPSFGHSPSLGSPSCRRRRPPVFKSSPPLKTTLAAACLHKATPPGGLSLGSETAHRTVPETVIARNSSTASWRHVFAIGEAVVGRRPVAARLQGDGDTTRSCTGAEEDGCWARGGRFDGSRLGSS